MVFGPRGRYSTDLDFTLRPGSEITGQIVLLLDRAVTEAYIKGVHDPMAAPAG